MSDKPRYFRIAVTKPTATEQIAVDMPSWNPVTGEPSGITVEEMKDSISEALTILDDRAEQSHMRTLAVYGLLQYIPDDARTKVIEIVDILTGKADPALVMQRWKAAVEETEDLEAARQAEFNRQREEYWNSPQTQHDMRFDPLGQHELTSDVDETAKQREEAVDIATLSKQRKNAHLRLSEKSQ
jgi:hypothetical protein